MTKTESLLRKLIAGYKEALRVAPHNSSTAKNLRAVKEQLDLYLREPELWMLKSWPPPVSETAAIYAAMKREALRNKHTGAAALPATGLDSQRPITNKNAPKKKRSTK
jgi:hypothetical protein